MLSEEHGDIATKTRFRKRIKEQDSLLSENVYQTTSEILAEIRQLRDSENKLKALDYCGPQTFWQGSHFAEKYSSFYNFTNYIQHL